MNWSRIIFDLTVWSIPVLLAVTLHEAAHGWVAWKLGDPTAKLLGRVTFNPFRHIDPMGTVVLPILLLIASGGHMMFGFAKPVPVNFSRLRHVRRDMVLVAAAGPATNLALALATAATFHVLPYLSPDFREWVQNNLEASLWINCLLAVFNMMPLPPLDGGRVAVGILPRTLSTPLARLERVGIPIMLAVVFILPWLGERVGLDLNVFAWLVAVPAGNLQEGIARLFGLI
jgi:Zn-dependent protease